MNDIIFKKYDKSVFNKISQLIDSLLSTNSNEFIKFDRYNDDKYTFISKDELLKYISEDIEYQKNIANEIVNHTNNNTVIRFTDYFWKCQLVDYNTTNYLDISVSIKSDNPKYGNVLFPINAMLTEKKFVYWEIIDINEALSSINELINELSLN